ncbi:MAG: dihydropteroate synthase [Deltaproteobacteria bacterium GWA2_54_12]|nr:MAG: dihydropteroate synthase [Deltaproteobacteria bacterium GWA2_54_12]
MEKIGVDPSGVRIMAPKQLHYNLKLEGLKPVQANILKQDMLSIGGEAAVARGAASCSVAFSDALVSGTQRQFDTLIDKLRGQSLGLGEAAQAMRRAIENRALSVYELKSNRCALTIGPATLIMGILNVTPDSFSDGGRFMDPGKALERALEMSSDGADWIDIGGESTRPGAEPVDAAEEMKRVVPVIEALAKRGLIVSIDTTKPSVAEAAIGAGASIVNDVSALSLDPAMAGVVARHGVPLILMHMRGTPKTMQLDTAYGDLMSEVYGYLHSRLEFAAQMGIDPESIIVDPGLGFGKSVEGNLELLRRLREFKSLGAPVLAGPSRKSFIGKTLNTAGPDERLAGTIAACVLAVANGAAILRVHDVKEARRAAAIADAVAGRV